LTGGQEVGGSNPPGPTRRAAGQQIERRISEAEEDGH
jgi:hypothetical protein